MAGKPPPYDPTNLPTLPDGSPNPNYKVGGKYVPGYAGMSDEEKALLDEYQARAAVNPADPYLQILKDKLAAGGGYSAIKDYIPGPEAVKKYLGGGGRIADAFAEAALGRHRAAGKMAYGELQRQTGASGGFGSTVAGISALDLADRYSMGAADIEAQRQGMRESITQGRIGSFLQGAGLVSGAAQGEQTAGITGAIGGGNLAMDQEEARREAILNSFGIRRQERLRPMDIAMRQWEDALTMPKKQSIVDTLAGGVIETAPLWW